MADIKEERVPLFYCPVNKNSMTVWWCSGDRDS